MMSRLSIRGVLTLIIAPLSLLVLVGSADALWQAYRAHAVSARIAVLAEVGDSLFQALSAGRLERGSLTAALGSQAPIAEADLPRITNNRAAAERGQAAALDSLASTTLPGAAQSLALLRERHAALVGLRGRADAAIRQPRDAREAGIQAALASAFDGWLEGLIALTDAVDGSLALGDAQVGQLVGLKRAAWAMRLYGGMEVLRLNAALAARRPLAVPELVDAALERGRARQAWSILLDAAARPEATPAFRDAVAQVERRYLGYANGAVLQRMAMMAEGRMPEVTLTTLQAENSVALNAIVDLALVVLRELVTQAHGARSGAQLQLAVNGAVALLVLGFTLGGLLVAKRRISGPIRAMTAAMRRLAARDFSASIPGAGRGDEIGEMAAAVLVFRGGMIEAERMAAAEREAQAAALKRAAGMQALMQGFEARIAELTTVLSSSVGQLENNATTMTNVAGRGAEQTIAIGLSAQGADQGVQTVATATEELAASIAEITRQVTQSQGVVRHAVEAAEHTDRVVQALSEGAGRISEVVALIHGIARQTNLLALNATIEAARAGDSGKGFAVVAGEVKTLAAETARATSEIGLQIGQIQAATGDAVLAIRGIARTVAEVNEITGGIAGAIQEQDAATREISASLQQVAAGNREVTQGVAAIGGLAEDTGRAAAEVLAASGALSRQTQATRQEVSQFLDAMRAA